MKTSRAARRRAVIGLAAVVSLMAACGSDDDDGGGADTTTAATGSVAPTSSQAPTTTQNQLARVDRNASFRYGNLWGHVSFDPHKTPSFTSDSIFQRPVYDQLLRLSHNDKGEAVMEPQLATEWKVSTDGLTIDFTLRNDVTFWDGTKLNAAAVKANLERAKAPDSTVASQLAAVSTVNVVDDTHVSLKLSKPDPGILTYMAGHTVGMIVNPAAFNTNLTTTPAGSGPFKLASATQNASVVYERWDGHWDKDAALVKQYTIFTVQDANARYNGVRAGTAQYDASILGSPHDVEARALVKDGYHLEEVIAPFSFAMLMNTNKAPLNDVRVRRAISMAMDRKSMSKDVLGGINPPSYQIFPKGTLGYDESLEKDPYNPTEAKRLVTEAGATGAEMSLVVTAGSSASTVLAEPIQQMLGDVGLKVTIKTVAPPTITTWRLGQDHLTLNVLQGEQESAVTLSNAYFRPDFTPGGVPADLKTKADAAAALPYGSAERNRAYQAINKELIDNPIHVPTVQFVSSVLARPNVYNSRDLITLVSGRIDIRGVGILRS